MAKSYRTKPVDFGELNRLRKVTQMSCDSPNRLVT